MTSTKSSREQDRRTQELRPPTTAKLDRRVEKSCRNVLGAAFDLLNEAGVGGFSVGAVSRRSGVAKTTIYRHWPTREALVIDACSRITAEQEVPNAGSLDGDLSAILTSLAHLLQTANWSSVLPSIVDIAERQPEFAKIHSQIQHGHAAPLHAVIERAQVRGELSADADIPMLVSELLGPLFYRRWFSREPLDDTFVAGIIRSAICR